MYECPNCGANMKFDIKTQLLLCPFCDTTANPEVFTANKNAEEYTESDMDVTIFSCTQCGGEIFTLDNTAAGFCSFCGASTMLESRISKEKMPDYIIPFTKTKDDCKKAYKAKLRKAIFAPKELKNEKYIDSFRGIYMPYWLYYMSQKGLVKVPMEKSHRKGDYIIHDHYNALLNVDCSYNGLSNDASASFADEISECLAPYDIKEMKPFTTAFFSGFYADTSDVKSTVYTNDIITTASDATSAKISSLSALSGYSKSGSYKANVRRATKCDDVKKAMFPVWFLSYRKNDRVIYATVNGQTGKIVSDIPIDIKKYLLGTLILTIPIFLILNLFFVLRPSVLLIVVIILALIASILHSSESSKIKKRDKLENDKGLAFLKNKDSAANAQAKKKDKSSDGEKVKSYAFLGTLIPIILCILVLIIDPVSDIIYYFTALLSFFGISFTLIDLIKRYNLLSTRKLPQFNLKGGDDRA